MAHPMPRFLITLLCPPRQATRTNVPMSHAMSLSCVNGGELRQPECWVSGHVCLVAIIPLHELKVGDDAGEANGLWSLHLARGLAWWLPWERGVQGEEEEWEGGGDGDRGILRPREFVFLGSNPMLGLWVAA